MPWPCQRRHTVWDVCGSSVWRPGCRGPANAVILCGMYADQARGGPGCRGLANAVILREVAVSIVECRGGWLVWVVRWCAEMDSATARRMTKFGCGGYFGDDEVWVRRALRAWLEGRGMTGGWCRRTGMPWPYQRRHTVWDVWDVWDVWGSSAWRPGMSWPCQRRHTARSRSIHSGVQGRLACLGSALAGGDGFCDCAQNDEVWVRRALRE